MASVRVYVKRQLRLDRLTFQQRQMYELGQIGVGAVKHRVQSAIGPNDAPAKPLTKSYAIWKTRQGKGNRRNLTLSGDMLKSFETRTVSEQAAKAYVTGRSSIKTVRNKRGRLVGIENRIKAWVNQQREPWMVFSPKNKAVVLEAARKMIEAIKPRLLLQKGLGGRQL